MPNPETETTDKPSYIRLAERIIRDGQADRTIRNFVERYRARTGVYIRNEQGKTIYKDDRRNPLTTEEALIRILREMNSGFKRDIGMILSEAGGKIEEEKEREKQQTK